jgi:EAL domain-containing protein (putative c-di-GMP-specific phosphodiesterase class I)
MSFEKASVEFNLPYNQASCCWLAVFAPPDEALRSMLQKLGMQPVSVRPHFYTLKITAPWSEKWKAISEAIAQHDKELRTEVALLTGDNEPGLEDFEFSRRTTASLNTLADSLWLGEAMLHDRIVCYMQPVLDKRGKVFGYEAFARVEEDKEVIGGGRIIAAAKGLSAEYLLDRYLHVKAVASFITSDLEGFLFINFVPGFIHRPEKYLVGLTDAAKFHGMPAKQIVLDFTHSETSHDYAHMKSIFDYCRSKGYSLSLDDISSVEEAHKILETIRPDFIKLDIDLVRDAQGQAQQHAISELVACAHDAGATVLAEGVETETVHQQLLKLDVDLFQGYLFSPPVAISKLKKVAG